MHFSTVLLQQLWGSCEILQGAGQVGNGQAGKREKQKRHSQLLLRSQTGVCLVACEEKTKQSTKQSWFGLAHLACCASAPAKCILQCPWSRGSPIAGAAKGLEPLSSGSRHP